MKCSQVCGLPTVAIAATTVFDARLARAYSICEFEDHAARSVVASAGITNSGNPIVGLYPWRSWLFVTPTLLLDLCAASLRVLRWVCLGAGLFFLTKPWRQVFQSGLSVADRCLELSKIGVRRPGSRSHSRVKGWYPDCLNDWAPQYRRQQGNDYH
jgi:hypothetical protein